MKKKSIVTSGKADFCGDTLRRLADAQSKEKELNPEIHRFHSPKGKPFKFYMIREKLYFNELKSDYVFKMALDLLTLDYPLNYIFEFLSSETIGIKVDYSFTEEFMVPNKMCLEIKNSVPDDFYLDCFNLLSREELTQMLHREIIPMNPMISIFYLDSRPLINL